MIQAVNTVNNNIYKNQNPNFGNKKDVVYIDCTQEELEALKSGLQKRKQPSKGAQFAGYLGTQFIAGVIFNTLLDGATNLFRYFKKNKPMMPVKEIATRSAAIGGMFALIGLVFSGISAMIAKTQKD